MPVRTRPNFAVLIALLALVMASGGTAVAAQAAKNSVTSKAIKNNAVSSKDLKDGSVASVDVADGSLGSGDVQDGSLVSADVKDDGLSGADIAESTLGLVPNATAVGGVQVTPLSLSLASGAVAVPVLVQSGTVLRLDCTGSSISIEYARSASGPPIVFTSLGDPGNVSVESLGPSDSTASNLADGRFTAAIVLPAGGSVTAEFAGIFETNASGANDCFFRGTITRVP